MIIQPAKTIRGRIEFSGDKSISHRAALIAALAEGTSNIRNFSHSADCQATLTCLQALDVVVERTGDSLSIKGAGREGLREPQSPLDCGNSGTTMRLLAGVLAGQDFKSILTGDESLRSRPMQRIIEPLTMMGATVSSQNGRAPLEVHRGKSLNAIDYELLVASAQVKSCILLAGLKANGRTEIVENEITRDHTELMLQRFGVQIETGPAQGEGEHARFAAVTGPAQLFAQNVLIPGDISSAAYFIAAAGLLGGSSLQITNVGLNPTRVAFLEELKLMGLNVTVAELLDNGNEPLGVIRIEGAKNEQRVNVESPLLLDGLKIAQLIDELPLLALAGSQIAGGIEIRDAAELRVKESDRIATTVQNLRSMGAEVEEFDDGLRVDGPVKLRGARIDPHGDHRIAMTFSVAGLIAEGETEIKDAECVAVSFPEFFDLLDSVIER